MCQWRIGIRGIIIKTRKEKENSINQERTKTMKVRFMLNKEARKAQAIKELEGVMKVAEGGYDHAVFGTSYEGMMIQYTSHIGDILRAYGIMDYKKFIENIGYSWKTYRKYDTFIRELNGVYDYAISKVEAI